MYLTHWGLTNSPFSKDRNRRSFFKAPSQNEALARLQFLVDHNRRLGLLCGPSGTGKSVLLDVFADQLRRNGRQVVLTSVVGRSTDELLWEIANQLGAVPGREDAVPVLWRAVADRVSENRWLKIDTILLLDDVDDSQPDLVTSITRLADIDVSPDARWTIVLATRENGYRELGERLLDRVGLRIDLARWQPQDTIDYVRCTFASAGGDTGLLDDEALRKLHELADGNPRRINRLVDLALVAGAGERRSHLDTETIESAAELAVV